MIKSGSTTSYKKVKGYKYFREVYVDSPIRQFYQEKAVENIHSVVDGRWHKYQEDPISFMTDVLDCGLTTDMVKVCESVRDNIVTVVKSANGTGKCLAYNEEITLANGKVVKSQDLLLPEYRNGFSILSVDSNLKRKISTGFAEDNGIKPVIELITKTGKKIIRTNNHPLVSCESVFQPGRTPIIGMPTWKNAEDFKVGDLVLTVEDVEYSNNKYIPEYELTILAYLIGDGCFNDGMIGFTNSDPIIIQDMSEALNNYGCELVHYNSGNTNDYRIRRIVKDKTAPNPIKTLLFKYGFKTQKAAHKFIPSLINELDNKQIAFFLCKLYSTDGWATLGKPITRRGGTQSRQTEIGYSSMSEQMCKDIQRLLIRFGITAKLRARKTTWTHKSITKTATAYCVDILDSKMIVEFCDKIGIFSKAEAVNIVYQHALLNQTKYKQAKGRNRKDTAIAWQYKNLPIGYRWEKVSAINKLEEQPTIAICVPGDNTYLTNFVEHNSFLAARIALWFFLCHPDSQVYTTCSGNIDRLKKILWGEIGQTVNKHFSIFEPYKRTTLNIARHSKSFITGLPVNQSGSSEVRENKFSGMHAPFMLFIIDEGDGVPEEVYKGIESCMSGGIKIRMLVLFNPRKQAGILYKKEKKGQANFITVSAFNHPNVISGQDLIPGAVTQHITLERINTMTRPLLDNEQLSADTFEVPDYLLNIPVYNPQGEEIFPGITSKYRKIEEPSFSTMVLGEYPSQNIKQLISREWIDRARANYDLYMKNALATLATNSDKVGSALEHALAKKTGEKPVFGLDVATEGDDSNVLIIKYGNLITTPIQWAGVDPLVTAEKAFEELSAFSVETGCVDGNGVGTSVAPSLVRMGIKALPIMVTNKPDRALDIGTFHKMRDQVYWQVREFLRSPDAMLPPDELLEEELLAPSYHTDNGPIQVSHKLEMKTILGRSPDRLDALAMCLVNGNNNRYLNFYGTCQIAIIEKGKILIQGQSYELKNVIEAGFIGYTENQGLTFLRVWALKDTNIILIVDAYRTNETMPEPFIRKVYETHLKRKLNYIGIYKDSFNILKTTWHYQDDLLYSNKQVGLPQLQVLNSDVRGSSRDARQGAIKDLITRHQLAATANVMNNMPVWRQFASLDLTPSDSRDALACALASISKQIS